MVAGCSHISLKLFLELLDFTFEFDVVAGLLLV